MDEGHIGVDESGKGDFFGPLVIAACYVGPEHLAELEGVKDSKKLTDATSHRLAAKIKAICPTASSRSALPSTTSFTPSSKT